MMRNFLPEALLSLALCAIGAHAMATPVVRDFEEFTSPPVTCCFGSGVGNIVTYTDLTVSSGASAVVMNGTGWGNMQTSGDNLYGTLDGFMNMAFFGPVNGMDFDLINGTNGGAFLFQVDYYDAAMILLETDMVSLNGFTTPGSVGHVVGNSANIAFVKITGNGDFAIDTIEYDGSSRVPEPASIALLGLGALALFAVGRRRKQ